MTALLVSFGREGDVLIAVVFLGLLALYVLFELVRGELRYRWIVRIAEDPGGSPTVGRPGPKPDGLPRLSAVPSLPGGPGQLGEGAVVRAAVPSPMSPPGSHRRLVADALLVARGFDPAVERGGRNGSGVVDRAEREALAVIAALREGDAHGRWMA